MSYRPILLAAAIAALTSALAVAVSVAKVSHAGWPRINGKLRINRHDRNKTTRGSKRSDELLGGNGNDAIRGGRSGDVLWGDYKPGGPTNQVDLMSGGTGRDFIYASHGYNIIDAGPGDDVIHAHYGRGLLDCGPGHDLVYFSHLRRRHWKARNCEQVTYHAGLRTLTPNG